MLPIAKRVSLPKQKLHYTTREKLKDLGMVTPALFLLALFTFYPLLYTLYLSFTKWNFIRPEKEWVGWKNYLWVFNNPDFYQVMKVTFLYTFFDVGLTMILGLLLALLLNKIARHYSIMRLLIFMPHYIAMVVCAMIFLWIFNTNYGILNQIIAFFGLEPVNWLLSPKTALWAIIIVTVWKSTGYAMMIFLAGLRGIPAEYYEAAKVDGATGWQRFWHITLPLLSPITLFLLVTSVIGSMQVFQSVDVMTGGGPLNSTKVIVYWIYETAFHEFRVGRSSALVVILFIILLTLTALMMKLSKRKVHYEG